MSEILLEALKKRPVTHVRPDKDWREFFESLPEEIRHNITAVPGLYGLLVDCFYEGVNRGILKILAGE